MGSSSSKNIDGKAKVVDDEEKLLATPKERKDSLKTFTFTELSGYIAYLLFSSKLSSIHSSVCLAQVYPFIFLCYFFVLFFSLFVIALTLKIRFDPGV